MLDVAAIRSVVIATDPGLAVGQAAAGREEAHSVDSSVNVGITLDAVSKRYPGPGGGTLAVQELSIQIPAGQLVAFVGPSGCGKTTTLKMIIRLIEPSSGRILLGEDDVTRVNPVQLRRRIGYVIQNVGLFP